MLYLDRVSSFKFINSNSQFSGKKLLNETFGFSGSVFGASTEELPPTILWFDSICGCGESSAIKEDSGTEKATAECIISGSYSGSCTASVIVSHELMKERSVKIWIPVLS